MEELKMPDQNVKIFNMKELTMDRVNNVVGCDDEAVLLDTVRGRMTVEGEGLKIERLTGSGGEIVIKGSISGIYFTPEQKKRRGFFSK